MVLVIGEPFPNSDQGRETHFHSRNSLDAIRATNFSVKRICTINGSYLNHRIPRLDLFREFFECWHKISAVAAPKIKVIGPEIHTVAENRLTLQ